MLRRLKVENYAHQLRSQFAQQRKGNGSVVDERAAFAGRGDLAREGRFAVVIQVVSVEECLQVPCSEIENAFDQAITFVVFQGGVVVLVPQQEAQRAEQDRLSGAGFSPKRSPRPNSRKGTAS